MSRSGINSDILESAIQSLEGITDQRGVRYRWKERRYDRPRSTVHKLYDRGTRITLFYKEFHRSPAEVDISVDSISQRLKRTRHLTGALIARTSESAIDVAPILAVDPRSRVVVTLGLSGRPLSRGLLTHGRPRSSPTEHAKLLGTACGYIELVGSTQPPPFDFERFRLSIQNRLVRSGLPKPDINGCSELILGLAEQAIADGLTTFVHGDLSHSNLLTTSTGISIIDFGWISRFIGFDIGLLSYRLSSPTKSSPVRSNGAVESMLEAYQRVLGDKYNDSSMRLVDNVLLVRGLTSRSPRLRSESREVLLNRLNNELDCPAHQHSFGWWWVAGGT